MLDKDATNQIQQTFDAHDCALTIAIENVTALFTDDPVPHTSPTLADLMALMEQSHKDILGRLDDMNGQLNDVTEDHCTLLGSVHLALTSLDSKANSSEITRPDQHIETMETNLEITIREKMESNLLSLCTAVDKITNLKANLSHITKKLIPDAATATGSLNDSFPLLPATSLLTTLPAPSLHVMHPLVHQQPQLLLF
jgi:hypothetical protein